MKHLSISTATAAVAISLASTAHAKEAPPILMADLDGIMQSEAPDVATTSASIPLGAFQGAEMGAIVQGQPVDLSLPETAPVQVLPIAGDAPEAQIIPALDAPVEIQSDIQNAIYDVDFLSDAPDGFLTLPKPTADSLDDRVVTARSVNPTYGNIDAFYGDIVAFYGDIDAFWGNINPFYGDIGAFWGDISPFYGDIGAFWGDIVAFDEDQLTSLGAFGKQLNTQVAATEFDWKSLRYTIRADGTIAIKFDGTPNRIRGEFFKLINQAEAQFGAAYEAKTGKNFRDTFVAEILAEHGIDLGTSVSAKTTLAKSDAARAAFFLDWNDSLMQYSGVDQVDHWMGMVNWTPAITQIQGEGSNTVIGIVDGSFAGDHDLGNNVIWHGGGTSTVGGHGAGVASLIAGAHDGEGIMGIAPEVQIATYNPFNRNNQASWDSVATGIQSLLQDVKVDANATGYVSVVNLSLGQPGWALSQGMADVFARPEIAARAHETTYVIAAGNDGMQQAGSIKWDFDVDTAFILVGSVDPNGQSSSFSNTPGNACLSNTSYDFFCSSEEAELLANRTIVAPGSLLLVSDGKGGVTRQSGTSLAAPLVSGAVALLHNRWPWLAKNPHETADIIFQSAQDLGAPGVDGVYGWGLLDVAASQAPLEFENLNFKFHRKFSGRWVASTIKASQLRDSGVPGWWQTSGVVLSAVETIGETHRDFAIPLTAMQYGTSTNAFGNGNQRMQDFVADRFARWLLSNGRDRDGDGKDGISQLRSNNMQTKGQWSLQIDALAPTVMEDGAMRSVHSAATLTNPSGNMSFTVGHGQGALALNGGRFGIISDHDAEVGGVNPVLGLASGEMFAGASYKPASATTLSVGFSAQNQDWEDLNTANEIERETQRQLGAREAQAITFGIEQKITDSLSVNAQWTRLNEKDALLGAQVGELFLGEGSKTDAVTVSAKMDFGDGLSFDLSLTGGATETDEGQLLATSGAAMSTAGQFAINKRGVMNTSDILRVSVGQPMTIESGELELRSDQIVDRQTGEFGVVSQFIGIDTKRRVTGEIVYATPVADNAEFGLIGRYISEGNPGQDESVMIGANFGWKF